MNLIYIFISFYSLISSISLLFLKLYKKIDFPVMSYQNCKYFYDRIDFLCIPFQFNAPLLAGFFCLSQIQSIKKEDFSSYSFNILISSISTIGIKISRFSI